MDTVCPSNLKTNVFTTDAVDNTEHNNLSIMKKYPKMHKNVYCTKHLTLKIMTNVLSKPRWCPSPGILKVIPLCQCTPYTKANNCFMPRISSSFVLGFTCFLTYHFIVPQESSIGLRSCKKQMFYTLNYECLQIEITSLKNMDIKESIIFQGLYATFTHDAQSWFLSK